MFLWQKKFAESLNEVIGKEGKLIACCTGNAANVTRATATGKNDTIEEYTKQKILRISCGVHTANLALHDLQKQNPDFAEFVADI